MSVFGVRWRHDDRDVYTCEGEFVGNMATAAIAHDACIVHNRLMPVALDGWYFEGKVKVFEIEPCVSGDALRVHEEPAPEHDWEWHETDEGLEDVFRRLVGWDAFQDGVLPGRWRIWIERAGDDADG